MKTLSCRTLSVVLCAILLLGAISVPAMALNSYNRIYECDDVVVDADVLNIRSGPGVQYARVGMLTDGYVARILEIEGSWGRIESGWISLDYVDLYRGNGGNSSNQGSSQPVISSNRVGYVTANVLNVRSGPGVQYQAIGQMTRGYRVTVQKEHYGWGKIDNGWVCLDYINFGDADRNVTDYDVKVIADRLNVRQGPGTGYSRIGQLTYGTLIEIVEVRGSWGRTNQGWICLDYVRTV